MKCPFYLMVFMLAFGSQVVLSQENSEATNTIKVIEKEVKVKGAVTDIDNKPLKGVVIYVDSVKTRVKTNRKGEFEIVLKPSNTVISAFSEFSGMLSLPYNGESVLNFVFSKDFKVISEMELAKLGYNIKTPKKPKKAPKDYSKYLDVYQLLVAEFPGVLVTGKTIRLRGTASNSVNSGQGPLIIINGTQAGSLDNIRPQEIKTIRVVRDEGASFYGARGANGVIVIQMKNSG